MNGRDFYAYRQQWRWLMPKGWTEYQVGATPLNECIGYVGHFRGKRWHADNRSWAKPDRGELKRTFATRHEAAEALWHISAGTATADTYGGYVQSVSNARSAEGA